jgi:hypothetical protein
VLRVLARHTVNSFTVLSTDANWLIRNTVQATVRLSKTSTRATAGDLAAV